MRRSSPGIRDANGLPVARNVRTRPPEVESDAAGAPPPSEEAPARRTRSAAPAVGRALRAALGFAMIAGIGTGVAWGARTYVGTSPRFAIGEVVIFGAKERSPEDIAVLAGVAKGQNVFSVDLEDARARLAADPWIESAEVRRKLPSTISIRVTEREAAGLVAMSEGSYLVARDGAVIKRLEAGDPMEHHVVTGVSLDDLVNDREGAARTIRRALDLAYEYERSELARRSPLEEVHVHPSGDLSLVVGKSGLTLRMGEGPYRRKLEQAARTVAELDRRGAKPDTIMLDDEARPDRVVVRMR